MKIGKRPLTSGADLRELFFQVLAYRLDNFEFSHWGRIFAQLFRNAC